MQQPAVRQSPGLPSQGAVPHTPWSLCRRPTPGAGHTRRGVAAGTVLGLWLCAVAAHGADAPLLQLKQGDHIVLIGNTLAEREQYFGHWETLLHSRFPTLQLVVRNLGWSADELTLRPRSKDFQNHGHTLHDHKADVILAFFGFNESFAGEAGLPKFERDLDNFIAQTLQSKYNGHTPPRLVLVSPIAHEDLKVPGVPDGRLNNQRLRLYTEAMKKVGARHGVGVVDLFTPTLELMARATRPLTFNGIHLTDEGYRQVAPLLDEALFGPRPSPSNGVDLAKLRAEVLEKNRQFFFDHRAVNGFYIYGGRKEPFGVVNFPHEFAKLRKMIANRDRRVWDVAQGKDVPAEIDDSNTGQLPAVETNFKGTIRITPPEEAAKTFTLPKGFVVELVASEREFPELRNPCQFAIDARGRLWVCTMPSYPMYLPGKPVDDKVLILEDTDGDGRADKQTVFADGLHVPTGIELGDGGAYVAQQPNLLLLKDTDGDDRADQQEIVLHGFDSADSHHAISAFTWDPGGALYFQEGTFHHTQVETPYGPQRCADAGVFRFEPRTWKFEVFVSYRFANPWGHVFDRWGQNFVADASPGANYFGTAFSGQVDYPEKHGNMKQFLVKQWRPTCGCEIVSSRNFPDEMQGDYLLNNCIGFLGVLQYRFREEGSGFFAEPVEPLLRSSDPNFRPVDLKFGPDGALYVCDWFNPLIGHMQHSLRDPNRDTTHGRIWRVYYKDRPLLQPPKIAGSSVPELLELLKTYEDRVRYLVRRELRDRDTQLVVASLEKWIAQLDAKDPHYQHHLLEALWVHQHHDAVNVPLLKRLLRSPDYRARAAATRVLCYWRDRVPDALELLKVQAADEHPRVRLEAVRAASFFQGTDVAKAHEVVLEALLHPQDYYLEYTTNETLKTLDRRAAAAGGK
jgi:glucose/arabinose dehydrogenase